MTIRHALSYLLLALVCLPGARAADRTASEWFDQGLDQLTDQKFADAEASLKEACRLEPRYKEAWSALAKAFRGQGKADLAAAALREASLAPTQRTGAPPALTDEQKQVLGAAAGAGGGKALPDLPKPDGKTADGQPVKPVRLSALGGCQYADTLAARDGSLHAVFNERADSSHAYYLYYRASSDGGATWSPAKNLSDDESGRTASYARLAQDAAGRIYAVWKYMAVNDVIDGPGGYATGQIVFRCLANGVWSPPVNVTDPATPGFSWSLTTAADGSLHLLWSQTPADAMRAMNNWTFFQYCNQVVTARLEGNGLAARRVLITPKPLPTEAEIAAADAAGHPIPGDDRRPRREGILNLQAMLRADGTMAFLGEHPGVAEGASDQQTGRRLVFWDGQTLHRLYEYEKYQSYPTWNDPPALLTDTRGEVHVLRAPEKIAVPCIRDYTLHEGRLGEPASVIECANASGKIVSWHAVALPHGRMAVMATVCPDRNAGSPYFDLYLTVSDGQGIWWPPINLTNSKPGTGGQPMFATTGVSALGRLFATIISGDGAYLSATTGARQNALFVQF
ncbi:MAG: hypothetical protein HZB16_11660 [Armatimonadetes bacterium]|nr:hypothetical protein [Armatimonadota bacterium]